MPFRPTAAALVFLATLSATSLGAQAADIARPVIVPTLVNPFEGFYLGGHFGGGSAERSGCSLLFGSDNIGCFDDEEEDFGFDYHQDGALLGAQVGINHAWGTWGGHNWIVGAEVSADVTGMHGTLGFDDEFVNAYFGGVGNWNYLALGLFKLGVTWGNWMLYADAGYGLAGFNYNSVACEFSSNHQGWAAGLGLAWATSSNNNWFIDWQRIDFEEKDARCHEDILFASAPRTDPDMDIFRIGFNHHFR